MTFNKQKGNAVISMSRFNPIEFSDYQEFIIALRAFLMTGKHRKRSYRVICRQTGFNSTSGLAMFLLGTRPLTPPAIDRLSHFLEWSPLESRYANCLTQYERLKRKGKDISIIESELKKIRNV